MRSVGRITERELRARARRPLTYWLRLGVAAVGTFLVVTTVGTWTAGGWQRNNFAFGVLAWIGFLLAMASAYSMMDTICGERRGGTLGLLFLTSLSGLEVVLGKFAASALVGVLIMAGFAPVLMVALLPGGVTAGEVVRVTLVLVETLLVGLALGVWVSVHAHDLLSASRMASLRLLGLLLVPSLVALMPEPLNEISLVGPLTTFIRAQESQYLASPVRFWISAAFLLIEVAVLLVLSSKVLARNWREELQPPAPRERQAGEPARRSVTPLGDAPPIPWLVNRQRRQRALFWIAAIMMSFVGSFGLFFRFVFYAGNPTSSMIAIISSFFTAFATAGSTAALALFALAAGRFLMEARLNGTLELLLSTPIGGRELIRGQKQALARLLAGPLVIIMMPACATLLVLVCFQAVAMDQYAPWYAVSMVLSAIRQSLNVLTACMLGLWFALYCRNAWTLMAWAAGLTAGVQWITGLTLHFLNPMLVFHSSGSNSPVSFVWKLWMVMSPLAQLIPAIVLILWANHRITQDLAGIADATSPWQDLRDWLRSQWTRFATGLRRARRWTPSGSGE